jgi:hypothetical protein
LVVQTPRRQDTFRPTKVNVRPGAEARQIESKEVVAALEALPICKKFNFVPIFPCIPITIHQQIQIVVQQSITIIEKLLSDK